MNRALCSTTLVNVEDAKDKTKLEDIKGATCPDRSNGDKDLFSEQEF